jgi:hypothetical protein
MLCVTNLCLSFFKNSGMFSVWRNVRLLQAGGIPNAALDEPDLPGVDTE